MNLYLSRLLLDPRCRQVKSEMAQPYEMHRTLMKAFPQVGKEEKPKAREKFGVLFRPDHDERRGLVKVYVQSNIEPDWAVLGKLNEDYLRTDTEMAECECKDIMPACRKIQNGQVLSFRLRANPTKRIAKKDDPMKGKRVELRRENEQIDWLMRKGRGRGGDSPGGFELVMKEIVDPEGKVHQVPRVDVCNEGRQTGRKRDETGDYAINNWAVLYDGLLRVTDSQAFLQTLVQGIGTGKAFGFGLLSVAPARLSGLEDEP